MSKSSKKKSNCVRVRKSYECEIHMFQQIVPKPFVRNECVDDALNGRPGIWCFSLEKYDLRLMLESMCMQNLQIRK